MPFVPPKSFNLADHLLTARIGAGDGDRVALRTDDGERTYTQVVAETDRLGRALLALDVRREQRVVLALPDGPAYVAALFGILKVGAVAVMVNPELPREQLAAILEAARAPVAVIAADLVAAFEAAADDLDHPPTLLLADPGGTAPGAELPAHEHHPNLDELADDRPLTSVTTHRDDPAIWLFSGGTTGAPKAVVQTHRSYANTTALYAQDALGYRADDITIAVPRLFFGYATGSNLLFPFSVGASSVLFREHPTPAALVERIRRHQPTILIAVPKMIAAMVDDATVGRDDLASLRLATSAGEALPSALYHRWVERFDVELLDGLGTAEMWHVFCSNLPGQVRPGTLGRAVPGFEIEVRDADGDPLPVGEVGRLWVAGDSRAIGYWQDMDRTAEAFIGRWYASSDLVAMDAEGYVTYVGRADDAMKIGGKWLLPADVEGVLVAHQEVAECAVIGVPDAQGLTKPVAVVVAADDAEPDGLEARLQAHVLDHLEPYKHPRRVIVVDELPRTHLGKVDRGALRDLADRLQVGLTRPDS